MDKQYRSQNQSDPQEIYMIYKHEGAEPPKTEIRSAEELTSDEYYEFLEDDRIIPENEESGGK